MTWLIVMCGAIAAGSVAAAFMQRETRELRKELARANRKLDHLLAMHEAPGA